MTLNKSVFDNQKPLLLIVFCWNVLFVLYLAGEVLADGGYYLWPTLLW